MRDAILIFVVLLCTVVALRRPVFGMLTFVCFSMLNPQSMTWGAAKTFPLGMLTAASTVIAYSLWDEPRRLPIRIESALLGGFWAIMALSSILALYPALAFERFVDVSKIFFMVFLMTSIINTEQRVNLLMRVIGLSLGFYAIKGFVFVLITGGEYRVFGPEATFLAGANPLGMAMAMNVPFLVYLLRVETIPWLRTIIKAMLVSSYPAVICTYSRGAWLALAAVTLILFWRTRHRFLIFALGGIAGVLASPAIVVMLPDHLHERFDELVNYDKDGSAISRFWNWEFCTRAGLAHPLHGAGSDFYSPEAYLLYYPEFLERWPGKVWSCHSMWFTVFGEHGFLGLIVWLLLVVSCFVSLRRLRASLSVAENTSWIGNCAQTLEASLVGFLVAGSFFDALYFDMFYEIVGIIVILKGLGELSIATNSRSSGAIVTGKSNPRPAFAPQARDCPLPTL